MFQSGLEARVNFDQEMLVLAEASIENMSMVFTLRGAATLNNGRAYGLTVEI